MHVCVDEGEEQREKRRTQHWSPHRANNSFTELFTAQSINKQQVQPRRKQTY